MAKETTKTLIKKMKEDLKAKALYLTQLDVETDKINKQLSKIRSKALYGNITPTQKDGNYLQYVPRSVKGSKRKIKYIGLNEDKLKFYTDGLEIGKQVDELEKRKFDIESEILDFGRRICGSWF